MILINGDIVSAQTWEVLTLKNPITPPQGNVWRSVWSMWILGLKGLKTVHTYFGGLRSLWMIALGLIPCKYSTPLAHCRAQLIT